MNRVETREYKRPMLLFLIQITDIYKIEATLIDFPAHHWFHYTCKFLTHLIIKPQEQIFILPVKTQWLSYKRNMITTLAVLSTSPPTSSKYNPLYFSVYHAKTKLDLVLHDWLSMEHEWGQKRKVDVYIVHLTTCQMNSEGGRGLDLCRAFLIWLGKKQ